jgi:transglutaminase-like putative cysteine protease
MVTDKDFDAPPRAQPFLKVWAVTVLFLFTADVLSPAAQAVANQLQKGQTAAPMRSLEGARTLVKVLNEAKDHLRVLAGHPNGGKRVPTAAQRNAHRAALRSLRDELNAFDHSTRAEFDATARLIDTKALPDVIRQRHVVAAATYRREMDALGADLDAALGSADEATLRTKAEAAFNRLNAAQIGRHQQKFDPKHLPNSNLKADHTHRPRLSPKEFRAAGLIDQAPPMLFAALNPVSISKFPSAADPAYLAATTEVVLTPDIVAKATALGGSPVAIFNWVRNNLQWLPTWGAVQDASHTLASRQGNAFDIATLTIALLRASGTPARYVHGTIDVPAAQFSNWAGGFQNTDAALDFAASGGIPLTAITAGGQIATIRMEHVWVEAAVDFVPSRGAVNLSADTWVPLDPAFKQLLVLRGLNVQQISGIDPTQVFNNFLATGTLNQVTGPGGGFDTNIPQAAMSQASASLQAYVAANMPNATVGQVFGGRQIILQQPPTLPASLPNHLVTVGARYASLPAQLEQQITFAFGTDDSGTPLNPQTFPWPKLNNQQVILSFRPATAADQAALNALVPGGTITDPSQLPASIPAYLVNVVPELRLNGTVIMTGNPMGLGQDLDFVFNPTFVSSGTLSYDYILPVGSYEEIAVVGGSVNPVQVGNAQTRLQTTKATLQANVPAQVATLTREQMLGDLFQASVLSYYAQYIASGYIAGLQQSAHHMLAAGLGSFGYEPNVATFFGVPTSMSSGGINLNIPIVNIVAYDAGNASMQQAFNTELGMVASSLESAVPEQTFDTSIAGTVMSGISAVKALALANAAGQQIYQITSANEASVLPLINQDAATLAEIQAAVDAGETVITHARPVSVAGWTGAGYIILDPVTGSGAFKIAGGPNGGFLKWIDDHSIPLLLLGVALAAFEAPIIFAIGIILAVVTAIASIAMFYEEMQENQCSGLFWLFTGLALVGVLAALIVGAPFVAVLALALYVFIGSEGIKAAAKVPTCQNAPPPPTDDGE